MSHNHHTETLSPKESMPAVEIHRYSKVIDYFRRRIESLHSKNSSTALKFLDALLLYGTGKGRVASYAAFAFKIIQLANQGNMLCDKSMAEWKKEDVDLLAKSVIEKNCSGTTKHLFVHRDLAA